MIIGSGGRRSFKSRMIITFGDITHEDGHAWKRRKLSLYCWITDGASSDRKRGCLRIVKRVWKSLRERRAERKKSESAAVIKLVDAQKWLNHNYPPDGVCIKKMPPWNNKGKTRSEVIRLGINEKNLEGNLELSGFVNLTILNCQKNKITNLDISKITNLIKLRCYNFD